MLDNPVFNAIVARRFGTPIEAGLGTLWWVRENQWRKVLPPRFYSSRDKHPALSIFHHDDAPLPGERVPVLYGTSTKHTKSVIVQGLSEERGEAHRAFFIDVATRPAFAYTTFDQEADVDAVSALPPIWPNRHKSRVNGEEMADLVKFLKERGLL